MLIDKNIQLIIKLNNTTMKQALLFTFVAIFSLSIFAQQRAVLPKEYRNRAVIQKKNIKGDGLNSQNTPVKNYSMVMSASDIGQTWYDLQTNRGMQKRIYLHDDGTMAGVWTYGPEVNPAGVNRGTGYNYFDGNSWGAYPSAAIESGAQAGWPSYAPWGENGEAYTCHDYYDGTILGTRPEKGTGAWNLVIQAGPTGAEDISFPRITTTGVNHDVIHILSTTWVSYLGQEGALLYAKTSDGGATWDIENQTFDDLGLDYTLDLGGDVYDFAEPKGGLIAFLVGDNWMDLVIMKSYDDGESWDKSLVWECPFPLHVSGVTDTFYCPDGSHDIAIDNNGLVHVAFSLTRALGAEDGTHSYFPGVDGVVYWNENMPAFSNDINALNPYGDLASELIEDYNLIGWSQDVDNNGSLDILSEWGFYNTGMSSQPQMLIDDQNRIFVVYSSVTEGFNNGISNFRHLWARSSPNNGEWWGKFVDLNDDIIYIFDECVYPSMSTSSDEEIHLTYQKDGEPGSTGGVATVSTIRYMSNLKTDLLSGVNENKTLSQQTVSQNYPNPFSWQSTVSVVLDQSATLSLEVSNLVGQLVYQIPAKRYNPGKNDFVIDASNLKTGVYFYTIKSGVESITKKMIVD